MSGLTPTSIPGTIHLVFPSPGTHFSSPRAQPSDSPPYDESMQQTASIFSSTPLLKVQLDFTGGALMPCVAAVVTIKAGVPGGLVGGSRAC